MKRIDAIVRTSLFNKVSHALADNGVPFFSFFEVTGFGRQKGVVGSYRGQEYAIDYIRRTKLEIIVEDNQVDHVVNVLMDAARTGEVGDGKIFVSDIQELYRIRTGETGAAAL